MSSLFRNYLPCGTDAIDSDILELKELQLEASRACARAHVASGIPSTSRFLSNVPVGLLPLLPEMPSASSPGSPSSPQHPRLSSPGLADACLSKIFSADTGLKISPSAEAGPSRLSYGSSMSSPTVSPRRESWSPSSKSQTPSPPDTPPRPLVTSVPAPPLTRKARNFAFLPLLDTPQTTPSTTPNLTPSTSGMSSPVLSPNGSTTSFEPINGGLYGGGVGFAGLGGGVGTGTISGRKSANTLGLERKLGFAAESSESEFASDASDEVEDEDDDWPHDWPGSRRHVLHPHKAVNPQNQHASPSKVKLPPSPPAEDIRQPSSAMRSTNNPYFPPLAPSSSQTSTSFSFYSSSSPPLVAHAQKGNNGNSMNGRPRLAAMGSSHLGQPSPPTGEAKKLRDCFPASRDASKPVQPAQGQTSPQTSRKTKMPLLMLA